MKKEGRSYVPYQIIHLLRKPGFVVRKVGDARMVIPTGPRMKEYQGVITINETGAFLFDLIKEEKTNKEMMDALMAEYEIDQETAYEALSAFVHQCNAAGLLVVDEVDKLPEGKSYLMTEETVEYMKQEAAAQGKQEGSDNGEDANGTDEPAEP